jgi:hypothetical protein
MCYLVLVAQCRLECQQEYGHASAKHAGKGSGEPCEIFNSVIGPHGATTQYMAPAHRECHLERVTRLYNWRVEVEMPARLSRMQSRACIQLEEESNAAQNLRQLLMQQPYNLTSNQVCCNLSNAALPWNSWMLLVCADQ